MPFLAWWTGQKIRHCVVLERQRENEPGHSSPAELKLLQPLWRNMWQHLSKPHMHLCFESPTLLGRLSPKMLFQQYEVQTRKLTFVPSFLIVPLTLQNTEHHLSITQWRAAEEILWHPRGEIPRLCKIRPHGENIRKTIENHFQEIWLVEKSTKRPRKCTRHKKKWKMCVSV